MKVLARLAHLLAVHASASTSSGWPGQFAAGPAGRQQTSRNSTGSCGVVKTEKAVTGGRKVTTNGPFLFYTFRLFLWIQVGQQLDTAKLAVHVVGYDQASIKQPALWWRHFHTLRLPPVSWEDSNNARDDNAATASCSTGPCVLCKQLCLP